MVEENESGPVHEVRHEPREKPFSPPAGEVHLEEITAHVERHFGKVANVFHEIVSDLVHIDVLIVEPTRERPYYVLVTSGMSDLPMNAPEGAEPRFAELVIGVIPERPFDSESMKDERVYWPIRHLKQLARMPHELDTWLAPGHTIAGDPPEPVAPGVPFCGFALLELLDPAARRLRAKDGTEIAFVQVVPMHRGELDWRLAQSRTGALDELFDREEVRLAFNERPALKGPDMDRRVDGTVASMRRGQRLVLAVVSVILITAALDVAARVADGEPARWTRLGLSILFAFYIAQGGRTQRWAGVSVLGLAAIGGIAALCTGGTKVLTAAADHWRVAVFLVNVPLWIAAALTLAFAPSVRTWYRLRPGKAKPTES